MGICLTPAEAELQLCSALGFSQVCAGIWLQLHTPMLCCGLATRCQAWLMSWESTFRAAGSGREFGWTWRIRRPLCLWAWKWEGALCLEQVEQWFCWGAWCDSMALYHLSLKSISFKNIRNYDSKERICIYIFNASWLTHLTHFYWKWSGELKRITTWSMGFFVCLFVCFPCFYHHPWIDGFGLWQFQVNFTRLRTEVKKTTS